MRYDTEHKQLTRARVLKEAAKAIRLDGPEKVSVAGVMARAGLTHGGFYAHFESKDDLIVATIDEMFAESRRTFEKYTADLPPRKALKSYVDFYLSVRHRDTQESGCPVPLLSGDLSRMPEAARNRFAGGVTKLTTMIQQLLEAAGIDDDGTNASSIISEMIGALSLSRAVSDRKQSDEWLARSRAALLHRLKLTKLH